MANVNTTVTPISAVVTNLEGWKLGFLASATKAAQNDTVTITNATEIKHVSVTLDATGAAESSTKATNVITLTANTTGAVSGLILYR
jgi:hypothetical protein